MIIKKISTNGQVSIPKQIQKMLNLHEGNLLSIYKQNNFIVIENNHLNEQLNQCVFRNGRISIPVEIRRLLNIKRGTPLMMEASVLENKIIIKHLRINPCFKS